MAHNWTYCGSVQDPKLGTGFSPYRYIYWCTKCGACQLELIKYTWKGWRAWFKGDHQERKYGYIAPMSGEPDRWHKEVPQCSLA